MWADLDFHEEFRTESYCAAIFVTSSNAGGTFCETKFNVQERSQLRMAEHNIRTDFNAMNVAEL